MYMNTLVSNNNRLGSLFNLTAPLLNEMSEAFKADLYDPDYFLEEKDGYVFEVELPGFKKEQVSLSVDKDLLRIKAERERRGKKIHANESYVIPSGADSSKIKATLEEGVLTVSFKKTKGSSIKIS